MVEGKNTHSNNNSNIDHRGQLTGSLEEFVENDQYDIVTKHPNSKGDQTVVFEDKDTGARKTFPNVREDSLEQGTALGTKGYEDRDYQQKQQ
jgi:hypothetical protein